MIWVTNGVYATGGKVMAGNLTNRVAVDKPVTVWSVNGPHETIIQGQWDPASTNGPGAVRCAWLTNGAVLSGFTLRGGATRQTSDDTLGNGGGVWCASTNAVVANCVISGNLAYWLRRWFRFRHAQQLHPDGQFGFAMAAVPIPARSTTAP